MGDIRQKLREEADGISPAWGLNEVIRRANHRAGVRRLGAGFIGLLGLVGVIGLVIALRPGVLSQTNAGTGSAEDPGPPLIPGTCSYGPWMQECPEADWARATLEEAGLTVSDELPAAFAVQHDDGELLFGAMDPANHPGSLSFEQGLEASRPFDTVDEVDGVALLRLRNRDFWTWTVWGLTVEVAINSGSEPSPEVLRALVRASTRVPY